jgi:hypothetical protein
VSIVRHRASSAVVAALLIWCAGLALPASAGDAKEERARIAAHRAAAKAALVERERACQREFLVTACIDAARDEQRPVLARLRDEELALDEAQRIENARQRREELARKAAAHEARAEAAEPAASASARAPGTAASARTPSRAASASAPPRGHAKTASQPKGRTAADQAHRAALEEQNKAKFEANARSAQAHRDAVEQRNAQRKAPGQRGAPLPVPEAESAARTPASAP